MELEPIIPLNMDWPIQGAEFDYLCDKVAELIEEHNKLLEAFKLHRHKYRDSCHRGSHTAHTDRPDGSDR